MTSLPTIRLIAALEPLLVTDTMSEAEIFRSPLMTNVAIPPEIPEKVTVPEPAPSPVIVPAPTSMVLARALCGSDIAPAAKMAAMS